MTFVIAVNPEFTYDVAMNGALKVTVRLLAGVKCLNKLRFREVLEACPILDTHKKRNQYF
jgi:hypothetical protein